MITQILPGIREVRTPLTAGYLWIAAMWLALHEQVPDSREEAAGTWEPIFRLSDTFTPLGAGIALSLAAYILGSISQGTITFLIRNISRFLFSGRIVLIENETTQDTDSEPRHKTMTVIGPHLSFRSWWSLDLLAYQSITQIRSTLKTKTSVKPAGTNAPSGRDDISHNTTSIDSNHAVDKVIDNLTGNVNDWAAVYASIGPTMRHAIFYRVRKLGHRILGVPTRTVAGSQYSVIRVATGLALELDSVKYRLLKAQKDQFELIDRLEAESHFRFAILAPLATIVTLLSIDISLWCFLGLLGVLVLFVQATVREFQASDAVVDRLFARDVNAPLLERLDQQATQGMGSDETTTASFSPFE